MNSLKPTSDGGQELTRAATAAVKGVRRPRVKQVVSGVDGAGDTTKVSRA
jgi:hypothetical protein